MGSLIFIVVCGMWNLFFMKHEKEKVLVTQSSLTLCNPVAFSLPGLTVPGILQARILEWVDMPFSQS